ncbi:MAG: 1-deoxy-D-xylulose-5-phosphate reductoisomerase [Gemmatales bacterium]|nr:1-deoxy-D-xylulose-5-phosphate reductoisomerase [Gemmatales bacterium]MDW8386160.1 1-deoxy-D-xylulose-5-phosphate reductoisomerase [Gemmatales bacterium]
MPVPRRRIAVLGSTGSIGTSTLDVIAHCSERLELVGVSAHSNLRLLAEQIERYRPKIVVLTDPEAGPEAVGTPTRAVEVWRGEEGIRRLVTHPEVDTVVVAIVGAAGLLGTLAAIEAGKTVAVANKETLVMAGPLVMRKVAECQASLVPVDSEHSAIFQLLQCGRFEDVERLILTGSGGPFRGKKRADLEEVTVEEALRHPTWKMGRKITVDSATLMNKALEIIEARWLFGMPAERIGVVIHPESIVHSFVEFRDGSVLAQLSPPDMRLPIQYALLYPERLPGPSRRLDWSALRALHFEPPDGDTFPAIQLGYETARRGGTCGAVLNAANEAAVQRFLGGTLRFLDIPRVCRAVLDAHSFSAQPTLEELLALDRWARQEVERWDRG